MMKKKLIEFENVTKEYKMGDMTIKALDGVDFSIYEGELVVILGASGAGKSTILNILGGMDTVTSGEVFVNGNVITKYDEKKLTVFRAEDVGFVFQFYNLIPNLTALENVEFASEVCKNHLNANEILGEVGLDERKDNFPSQLSGGEQQRVAIARAVTKNPLLLLCDEPTGALDYKTGKSVLKLLQDLNKKIQKCIVLITHNAAIAPIADRVIKVKSGKIEEVKTNDVTQSIEEIEW
jgi:putative ABC transport system ATP-binding protein